MPTEYMTMSGVPVEVPPDETPEERRERERDLPMHQRTQEFGLLPGIVVDMGPANAESPEEKEEEVEEQAEEASGASKAPAPKSRR